MITLKGQPKSTQHCYKMTCRGRFASLYMSKDCKDIKADYQIQAKQQWKHEPLTCDLELEVKLYFGTKRVVDVDNFNKLWADSLSGIVYDDDKQIQKLTVSKHYDKEDPRVTISMVLKA